MSNEEIITALRNAIEHGDSLESAVQIMINSGYNPAEVNEASKFLGSGSLNMQEQKSGEELLMPEQKKSLISKFNPFGKDKKQSNQIIPQQIFQQQTTSIQPPQQTPLKPQSQQLGEHSQISSMQIQQQAIQPKISPQRSPQGYSVLQQQIPQTTNLSQRPIQRTQQPQRTMFQTQKTPTLNSRSGQLSKNLQKIKPIGQSHKKEIILLIILMGLIGILALTIIFRETILGWFG